MTQTFAQVWRSNLCFDERIEGPRRTWIMNESDKCAAPDCHEVFTGGCGGRLFCWDHLKVALDEYHAANSTVLRFGGQSKSTGRYAYGHEYVPKGSTDARRAELIADGFYVEESE